MRCPALPHILDTHAHPLGFAAGREEETAKEKEVLERRAETNHLAPTAPRGDHAHRGLLSAPFDTDFSAPSQIFEKIQQDELRDDMDANKSLEDFLASQGLEE